MSYSLVQQRLDAFARITAVGEPYELVDREDIRRPVQTFVNAPTSLRQVYEDAVVMSSLLLLKISDGHLLSSGMMPHPSATYSFMTLGAQGRSGGDLDA